MGLNTVDDLFKEVDTNRPLFTGFFQAVENFEAIENLSSPVFFNHERKGILCPLACGKSFMTTQTFSPPANGLLILAETGINHFTLWMIAERAFHSLSSFFES
jgi:hypothetical protein